MADDQVKLDAFLNRYLPGYVEKVESVQGGLINVTYRLYLKDELPSVSLDNSNDHTLLELIHQLKPKSLIVKISYPYYAALGKAAILSVDRQKIEERALKLFNKMPFQTDDTKSKVIDLSSILDRNKTIRVGKTWVRDEIENALLMDDHGPIPTLAQWFSSEKTNPVLTESIITSAQTYGEQLANFLVDMQVSSLPYIEQIEELLRNIELQGNLSKMVAISFEKLRTAHNLVDADEIASIFLRCFKYDTSRVPTDGQVLSHGDYNVLNFLLNEEKSTIAIIDWELAGVRSPAHDVALFLARAQVFSVINPKIQSAVSFMNGFMDGYRESAKKNDVKWYKNEHEQYVFAWYLAVAYGVALLRYSSAYKCCPPQDGVCAHQRSIATIGIDYIKRCRLGPEKATYDSTSSDPFLGRLFQASHTN